MGSRSPDVGRLTIIKRHSIFHEIFDFRGCGFFEFSNIAIFGGLTKCILYNFVCEDVDCGSEDFFRPRGLRTQRPAQTGSRGENLALRRFDPMILCSFLWRFRWRTLENHNSKPMMVYDQITFFYKTSKFPFFFDRKIDFLIEKLIFGFKKTRKNIGGGWGGAILPRVL